MRAIALALAHRGKTEHGRCSNDRRAANARAPSHRERARAFVISGRIHHANTARQGMATQSWLVRSARRDDVHAKSDRGAGHPLVVGAHARQVGPEGDRGGQVDGVQ